MVRDRRSAVSSERIAIPLIVFIHSLTRSFEQSAVSVSGTPGGSGGDGGAEKSKSSLPFLPPCICSSQSEQEWTLLLTGPFRVSKDRLVASEVVGDRDRTYGAANGLDPVLS